LPAGLKFCLEDFCYLLGFFAGQRSQEKGFNCLFDEQRHKKKSIFLKMFLKVPGKNYSIGEEIDTRLIDEAITSNP
jgi:hypothetical protein